MRSRVVRHLADVLRRRPAWFVTRLDHTGDRVRNVNDVYRRLQKCEDYFHYKLAVSRARRV